MRKFKWLFLHFFQLNPIACKLQELFSHALNFLGLHIDNNSLLIILGIKFLEKANQLKANGNIRENFDSKTSFNNPHIFFISIDNLLDR